jgi:peptidoglycan/xylan/chitin deacetylase (PgdA/CDA1 family)
MKRSIYELVLKCAGTIGITSRMFSRAIRKQDSNLLALTFHEVSREQFTEHLHFLDRHFLFADLDELVRSLITREFPSDLTAVVTFDDGLQNFYDNAFPVINETGIPIANYITTGVLDSGLWYKPGFDRVFVLSHLTAERSKEVLLQGQEKAKKLGLIMQPGLTSEQLIELDRHPKVTIGAHSVTHPMLVETTYDVCRREIFSSKRALEDLLGHEIRHFAYPYGSFSERESSLVQEAGLISGAGTQDTWIARESDPLSFPRKGAGPKGNSLHWLQYRIGK